MRQPLRQECASKCARIIGCMMLLPLFCLRLALLQNRPLLQRLAVHEGPLLVVASAPEPPPSKAAGAEERVPRHCARARHLPPWGLHGCLLFARSLQRLRCPCRLQGRKAGVGWFAARCPLPSVCAACLSDPVAGHGDRLGRAVKLVRKHCGATRCSTVISSDSEEGKGRAMLHGAIEAKTQTMRK